LKLYLVRIASIVAALAFAFGVQGFAAHKDDIVGRHADIEGPQDAAARRLEFEQLVREIAAHIEPRAVGGQREPARNLLLASRRIGRRHHRGGGGRHHRRQFGSAPPLRAHSLRL
jgi:hypothetical protein